MDRIRDFRFLIFDLKLAAARRSKSEIKNQKSKILCTLSILVNCLLLHPISNSGERRLTRLPLAVLYFVTTGFPGHFRGLPAARKLF
jgi:hypothetical protein